MGGLKAHMRIHTGEVSSAYINGNLLFNKQSLFSRNHIIVNIVKDVTH